MLSVDSSQSVVSQLLAAALHRRGNFGSETFYKLLSTISGSADWNVVWKGSPIQWASCLSGVWGQKQQRETKGRQSSYLRGDFWGGPRHLVLHAASQGPYNGDGRR